MRIQAGKARISRRGMTRVEVIVIGLVAMVLTAFGQAMVGSVRGQARSSTCQMLLRGFGQAMHQYAAENEDWIPGANTSGLALQFKRLLWSMDPNVLHAPDMPVQQFDWMTPLVPYLQSNPLPANRAARWHELWTTYRCPQQTGRASIYAGANTPDVSDFTNYEWPGSSYLMPMAFQAWGRAQADIVLGPVDGHPFFQIYPVTDFPTRPVQVDDYFSKLDHSQLGRLDRKLFVADGSRYLDSSGVLTFDIDPLPAIHGAFSSSGAWWPWSTTYGVAAGSLTWDDELVTTGSPSDGANLELTYRHGLDPTQPMPPDGSAQQNRGLINTVAFDGHVAVLNDRQSRDIWWWYPRNTTVADALGMTVVPPGPLTDPPGWNIGQLRRRVNLGDTRR